jgi:hypothetical protein
VNSTKMGAAPMEPTVHMPNDPIEAQIAAWAEEATPPYFQPRFRRLKVILPAVLSTIVGAVAALLVMHYTTEPKTVTVTKTVEVAGQNPDNQFLMELANHGIKYNGVEPVKQRFLQYAHYVCYQLAPPNPQPFDTVAVNIQSIETADQRSDPWVPTLTTQDAQNLVRSAVRVYCPQLTV